MLGDWLIEEILIALAHRYQPFLPDLVFRRAQVFVLFKELSLDVGSESRGLGHDWTCAFNRAQRESDFALDFHGKFID